jgi:hypothetical protein
MLSKYLSGDLLRTHIRQMLESAHLFTFQAQRILEIVERKAKCLHRMLPNVYVHKIITHVWFTFICSFVNIVWRRHFNFSFCKFSSFSLLDALSTFCLYVKNCTQNKNRGMIIGSIFLFNQCIFLLLCVD